MVGRQGFEPWTNGLKGRCSTAELPTRQKADAQGIGQGGIGKQSFSKSDVAGLDPTQGAGRRRPGRSGRGG